MTKTYPQELHAIWNSTLHDPAVPASSLIMEAMNRAYRAGFALEDGTPDDAVLAPVAGKPLNIFDAAVAPRRQFKPK